MSRERFEHQAEPYWQQDLPLGEALLQGELLPIRLRLHRAREVFRGREELIPLAQPQGERLYLHAKPYIAEPQLELTITTTPPPSGNGEQPAIGTVLESQWIAERMREIGQAQGWCYPQEQVIVLWECYLFDWFRQEDPLEDAVLGVVWSRFEQQLLQALPEATRIVTPAWEDLYPRERWQSFLAAQGYQPVASEGLPVFAKAINRADAA